MKKPEKLYEGNMRKKYLLFAIPLILSALLSQSYNFVNSMMIGKFIGSEAFAATAVIKLESRPPDKNVARGTSDTSCRFIESHSKYLTFSIVSS